MPRCVNSSKCCSENIVGGSIGKVELDAINSGRRSRFLWSCEWHCPAFVRMPTPSYNYRSAEAGNQTCAIERRILWHSGFPCYVILDLDRKPPKAF
jgi:hypothetical protein